MKIKTMVMLLLYFSPYFLVLFGAIVNPWLVALSWVLMGFGMGVYVGTAYDCKPTISFFRECIKKTIPEVISNINLILTSYSGLLYHKFPQTMYLNVKIKFKNVNLE